MQQSEWMRSSALIWLQRAAWAWMSAAWKISTLPLCQDCRSCNQFLWNGRFRSPLIHSSFPWISISKYIFPKCIFPKYIFPKYIFPKYIFPQCIFVKCTQLMHLLSFVSLLKESGKPTCWPLKFNLIGLTDQYHDHCSTSETLNILAFGKIHPPKRAEISFSAWAEVVGRILTKAKISEFR